MAEEIFDPLRRTVEGVATGVGDVVGGIGKGISSAVGGVGDAVGGLLGGFQNMPADDRMALINTLGRTGAALMALGQPGYNPKLRQEAIMALGNVPGQVATDRFKSAQSKLMTAQMQNAQRKLESIKKLDALRSTPEGVAKIYKLTQFEPEFIKTADPELLENAIVQFAVKRASRPIKERILEAEIRGAGAVPSTDGAAATPGAAAVAPAASGVGGVAPSVAPSAGGATAPSSIAARTQAIYEKYPQLFADEIKKYAEAQKAIKPAEYYAKVERGKAEGKLLAGAENNLLMSDEMISLVDRMMKDPYRESSTGIETFRSYIPYTSQAGYRSLVNQLGGKAFLEAYKTLKGTGQITEKEGQKALEAISRVQDRTLSEEDHLRALKDLRESTIKIRDELRKKLGLKIEEPATPAGGASSGGYRVINVR